jgi:enediyne biosynthesis protein E4
LDLFVCTYLKWSKEDDLAQDFQLTGGGRAYGRPQDFEGTFCRLYRNEGDGRFTDVSAEAGIQVRNPLTGQPMGKSLGVIFHDFDGDGWMDIVVANDTVQNFLFHNQGDGTFHEIAMVAGIAFDMAGAARGAMGIDAARFRNNEAVGIAIGNFANEATALYVLQSASAVHRRSHPDRPGAGDPQRA